MKVGTTLTLNLCVKFGLIVDVNGSDDRFSNQVFCELYQVWVAFLANWTPIRHERLPALVVCLKVRVRHFLLSMEPRKRGT